MPTDAAASGVIVAPARGARSPRSPMPARRTGSRRLAVTFQHDLLRLVEPERRHGGDLTVLGDARRDLLAELVAVDRRGELVAAQATLAV